MNRFARAIAAALLAGLVPAASILHSPEPLQAQRAQPQTTVEIGREITKLEEERKTKEEERVAKDRELKGNSDEQGIARAAGDQQRLARLKREGNEIANQLNEIVRQLGDIDVRIEEKFRLLRAAGRTEVKALLAVASGQAGAGNVAGAGDSLKLAAASLDCWRRGVSNWKTREHVYTRLRQPALGENRAAAQAELTRLNSHLRETKAEAELEGAEIADITALDQQGIDHADWPALKSKLAELKAELAKRKAELDRLVTVYEARKKHIEDYLAGK